MIAREKGRRPLKLASGKDVVNYFADRSTGSSRRTSKRAKNTNWCGGSATRRECRSCVKSGRLFRGTYSIAHSLLSDNCNWPQLNLLVYSRCCGLNCVNVVFLLGQELNNDTSTTDQLMRAMLLLEPFLRSDIVKMEVWRSKISFFRRNGMHTAYSRR